MQATTFVYFIFLVFTGAALLATVTLYTRQSLLVAYILLGFILGPSGFKLVPDMALGKEIGEVGIIFLLFLLGLELTPVDLLRTFRQTTFITLASSFVFAAVGFCAGYIFGFNLVESLVIGAALMFSSTIMGLKLLPARVLHHKQIGELMISVLLLQDLIAIVMLILVHGTHLSSSKLIDILLTVIALPVLIAFSFFLQTYVIEKLFNRFEKVQEYVFLLALGWCLGLAELATVLGLPAEIGAFLAGISIAQGPIAMHIAENLKPLRDFCLVVFFFAIGAGIDIKYLPEIWLPVLVLASVLLFVKPWVFKWLFMRSGESKKIAIEASVRLGQGSEFSLLLAYIASEASPALIGDKAGDFIQATTLLTFLISSYLVVLRYPTPMAFSDKLRRE